MKLIHLCFVLGCTVLIAPCGCTTNSAVEGDVAATTSQELIPSAALPQSPPKAPQVEAPHSEKPSFYTVDHYDAARNPADDLAQTVTRAKAEKKRILIQVGGDWRGWCRLMTQFIETNAKVREAIQENYLLMKVTENGDHKNDAFLSQYASIPG